MAQALINDPGVFLDEPMSGLDPLGRHQMREIILLLQKRQDDFFQPHSQRWSRFARVAILAQGELICSGPR